MDLTQLAIYRRVTIKQFVAMLVLVGVLSGVAVSAMSFRMARLSAAAEQDWQELRILNDRKARSVSYLVSSMGYGGLIHAFKNYVIRNEPDRLAIAQQSVGGATVTLRRILASDLDIAERAAARTLLDAVEAYGPRLERARQGQLAGERPPLIDARVRYDDTEVEYALQRLRDLAGYDRSHGGAAARAGLLMDLHGAMGYGGLIHRFKDYVLRGEPVYASQAHDAAREARAVIAQYRATSPGGAEMAALEVIEETVNAYAERIDRITEGHAAGLSVEEIDRQVRYDDGPTLVAFRTLQHELNQRLQVLEGTVSGTLDDAASGARIAAILTVVTSILSVALIALGLYVFVIRRSHAIAENLERLASGETAMIGAYAGSGTEFGAIARAAQHLHERSQETIALRTSQLDAAEKRAQSVLSAARSGIFLVRADGKIVTANQFAQEMFDPKRSMAGRGIGEFLEVPRLDNDTPDLAGLVRLARAIDRTELETEGCRTDGSRFPAWLSIGSVGDGPDSQFVLVVGDLTERKEAEALHLEVAENRRVAELKNEFISTVSHELRTPLTSITGALGLLDATLPEDLPDRSRRMLQIADSNCKRLIRLVNDILDLERIEAGRLDYAQSQTELGPIIETAVEELRPVADARDIRIVCDIPEVPILVDVDSGRIVQVTTNLLSNAVSFTPDGEVVHLTCEVRNGSVHVAIVDRGPGVPLDFHDRIFRPFSQAGSAAGRTSGGSGLGLSIAQSIIRDHLGSIGFQNNEDGPGATFWFTLPTLSWQDDTTLGGLPERPTLLICEDDPDVAMLIALLVDQMGFAADTVGSVEEALSALARQRYAGITLDLSLGTGDGLDLLKSLRDAPDLRDMPVVVISGVDGAEALQDHPARDMVTDWIVKPVRPERLRVALDSALRGDTGAGGRVLLVEDDLGNAEVLNAELDERATVDRARTLAEARNCLLSRPYDLVVLDLQLPDGAGETLLPAIRANRTPPPEILIFTISDPAPQLRAEASAVLVKSRTDPAELRARLTELLRRGRSADSLANAKKRTAR